MNVARWGNVHMDDIGVDLATGTGICSDIGAGATGVDVERDVHLAVDGCRLMGVVQMKVWV